MKRIFAWIGILAIIMCFLALVYFTVTGAPANVIVATLFCMLLVPILFHGFQICMNLVNNQNNSKKEND